METNEKKKIKKIIEENSERIDVLEENIDLETQMEYIKLHNFIDFDKYSDEEVLDLGKKIIKDKTINRDEQKKILILLAHMDNSRAYNLIDRYLKSVSSELKNWAILCFQESYMNLSAMLAEEDCGFVSAALGGKNDKLRYYFIISPKAGLKIRDKHKKIAQKEFQIIFKKANSEIETIEFKTTYALFKILASIDEPIGILIEKGIKACNKNQDFFLPDYYVSNLTKPTQKEIKKYLFKINSI